MPIQRSGPIMEEAMFLQKDKIMSDDDCLFILRKKELLTYHFVCEVFRAQGHLTPAKLKLLKEVAEALCVTRERHLAEVRMALNNDDLERIAEVVAGPGTEVGWRTEAREHELPPGDDTRNFVTKPIGKAYRKALKKAFAEGTYTVNGNSITLKEPAMDPKVYDQLTKRLRSIKPHDLKPSDLILQPCDLIQPDDVKEEKPELKKEDEIKEKEKDDVSSSTSKTSEVVEEILPPKEREKEEKATKTNAESDTVLMPPPLTAVVASTSSAPAVVSSPVPALPSPPISIPTSTPDSITTVITSLPSSSIHIFPSSSAVITVPPSSSILSLSPDVITVPPSTSFSDMTSSNGALPGLLTTSTSCEINECTPVLSEDMQFVSLPSLVVVPPPEPVITVPNSSSFSPTPTLVLPTGMSLQLKEKVEDSKNRKRTLSQGGGVSNSFSASSPKTMALSHISKMTPVMVTVSAMSTAGLKATPTISRSKMAATSQHNLTSSTQKVILVSNTSGSAPVLQQPINMPVGVPVLRASQPRLKPTPVAGGLTQVRPKMVAKCRQQGSPVMIPVSGHNLQLNNTFTIKQDNVTVVDTSGKKVPVGPGTPAKILPKPQTSMFIVNPSHGPQKISTPISIQAAGSQSTRMLAPKAVEGSAAKHNVVILQKGDGKTQRVTLTNTSKDLVQKLMSKKCVVIKSSKATQKTITPKQPPPPPARPPVSVPVSTSSQGNVVVLDLSQEQYRQNLSSTTLADILKASGILAMPTNKSPVTSTPSTAAAPEQSNNWLSTEASKSLALEEVTIPLGQSESIVTLDEAVELLGQSVEQPVQTVVEVEPQSSTTSNQILSVSPVVSEDLAASNVTFMSTDEDTSTSQVLFDDLLKEDQREAVTHTYQTLREGAVTIQHSNIDMPANMSLEEYSSQQFENQGLN